jgi:hypothetical protein
MGTNIPDYTNKVKRVGQAGFARLTHPVDLLRGIRPIRQIRDK